MSLIERPFHFKTRLENPGPNRFLQLVAGLYCEITVGRRIKIIGDLNIQGPAALVSNHVDSSDPNKIQLATELTVQRLPIFWVRRTLVDPKAPESKVAIERRVTNDELNEDYQTLPWHKKAIRQAQAWALRTAHPLPVDIGENSIAAIRATISLFEKNRLVAIFTQGTRKPQYDMLDSMRGVAYILVQAKKKGIDVPVVPISVSPKRDSLRKIMINIGEPFYLNDMPGETEKEKMEAAEEAIVDRIANLILDPDLNRCWWLNRYLGWPKHEIDEKLLEMGDQAIYIIDLYRNLVDYFPERFLPTEEGLLKEKTDLKQKAIFFL